jgi:alanine racemase
MVTEAMRPEDVVRLRPAWVEIDLGAVRHNVRIAKRLAGAAKLYAVCKGDGYGGGLLEVARASVAAGADALAVGAAVDALALRRDGLRCPVLLYASSLPEDAAAVARLGVTVTIHDVPGLQAFAEQDNHVEAFVKVDCGLGRLGFNPEDFSAAFTQLAAAKRIQFAGIYAHLALPEESAAVDRQMRFFDAACAAAEQAGFAGFDRMVSSSRAMLGYPELNLTAINPGRFILGMMEPPWLDKADSQPVVRAVKSRIIQIKDQPSDTIGYGAPERQKRELRTAVLPIGFGEGFPHLPPCHQILVCGQRAPVLSRRGIEHTVIDVTRIVEARIGSEAVLLGTQGRDEITAVELAEALNVPLLELLPRLARCAPQRYFDGSSEVAAQRENPGHP